LAEIGLVQYQIVYAFFHAGALRLNLDGAKIKDDFVALGTV